MRSPRASFEIAVLLPWTAVLLGLMLLRATEPVWWAGGGLVFAGALSFFRWLQVQTQRPTSIFSRTFDRWGHPWTLSGLLLDLLAVVGLLLVAWMLVPDMARGFRPISHDHTVHFAKAMRLERMLFSEGRLWGWSQDWFAGYPAQYLYSFGADLFVVLVHKLSFGLLRFSQAYAVAFWLHWWIVGYGIYACGRAHLTRGAGWLAAILFITDLGAYRVGGWSFTADWGVWPLHLSVGFSMLAVARLPRVLEGKTWRDLAWFGVWMGAAILTHPVQLIHFAALFPLVLLAHGLQQTRARRWLLAPSLRWLGAFGLGICFASVWLLPFLSVRDFTTAYGAPWWSTFRMGTSLYLLDLLPGTWSWILAVGFLGILGMLFARRFSLLLFSLFTLSLMLAGSTNFMRAFHAASLTDSFRHIQFLRFALLIKPYLFLACGYVAVAVISRLEGRWQTHGREALVETPAPAPDDGASVSNFLHLALVGFLLAPLAVPFFGYYRKKHLSHALASTRTSPYERDKAAFVRFAKAHFVHHKRFFSGGAGLRLSSTSV